MPARIIREGWIESERIAQLDAVSERFFLRLCLRADDYGRFHGNPILLKSSLFPLAEDIRSTDIPRWLAACETAGLVRCYDHDGKRFLEIPRFDQRTRAQKSKFPAPADDGQMPGTCQTTAGPPRTDSDSNFGGDNKVAGGAVSSLALPFDSPEFSAAWKDFEKHRSEIRKPLKPTSTRLALKELAAMGPARAIAALQHTIAKGWQGIREPDPSERSRYQGTAKPSVEPEPEGWRSWLNDNCPNSAFSRGGLQEGAAWSEVEASTRAWIVKKMGASKT